MANFRSILKRIVIVGYIVVLHVFAVFYIGEKIASAPAWQTGPVTVADPTEQKEVPTPLPVPSVLADPVDANANIAAVDPAVIPGDPNQPIIPVAGVRPDQLLDTYTQARGEDRLHAAIDIMAPGGTPVLAAVDGEIAKFWDSEAGGITIYQYSADKTRVYYYAHLQRRTDGLQEKQFVKRGSVIGYVGDTGNAGPGNTHLHFSISLISDPAKMFDGTPVNPYPILKQAR